MKFIHAADIHLDSPMLGLERYEGAPVDEARAATRGAFVNLVDACLAEQAAFLLIAGDLYDQDWRDYNTGLFFAAQMSRLREVGIRVFVVAGNHDAASVLSRNLRLPENVHVFSTEHPETVDLPELGVAVHGQGYARRDVTDDLAAAYPAPVPGFFNIGLLHTAIDGRPGHDSYAPCSSQALMSHGYEYWALGHVHEREVLEGACCVVFPGNIQGRHVREQGAKGATVVTVEDREIRSIEPLELDVMRWTECEVDLSDAVTVNEAVDRTARQVERALGGVGDRLVAVRVHLVGHTPLHHALLQQSLDVANDIRAVVQDFSSGRTWVEKVLIETTLPVDIDRLGKSDGPVAGLLRSIKKLKGSSEALSEEAESFRDLAMQLPRAYRELPGALDPSDPEAVRVLLSQVEQVLIDGLVGREEDA